MLKHQKKVRGVARRWWFPLKRTPDAAHNKES